AKVHEDGGVVTLEYEENWRFHFDQVVARREELETLVEKVAGPGYVVDLKGPRGSVGGGRGGRGRGAKDRSDAVRTRPDEDGTPASRSAASSGPTAHQEQAKSPARTEPAPAERQDATPTRAEPTEAKPLESEPLPGQEPASLADDLPEGFWDDGASEAAPDGAVPGVDDSGGPDASGAGTGEGPSDEASLSRLQALFPGRVVEFVPNAKSVPEEAAPLPSEDESEGYDDDGQDRLGFGAPPPREG
ncbi:MAG TPA: hypothetical protein VFF10_01820, partial [Trueperaceae bacterium]|nr:hypothetical protein [Trueperaceae bacterium]